MPEDRYTHGHHASVVGAHATRTIANSAAFLEPHLRPDIDLLDVGCGPGSITIEFAQRADQGSVLGVDVSPAVIDQATAAGAAAGSTARFEVMDLYALDLPDDRFDVVYAHQVLQHVSDPVAALVEMRRVVKPDGVVAVRDADYAAMHWAPTTPLLERWLELYRAVAYGNDAEPDAGRYLLGWAQRAGFTAIDASVDPWLYATPERRAFWGGTWAERTTKSSLATQAIEAGLTDAGELGRIAAAWRGWIDHDDAWFVVVHGELLCRG